MASKAGPAKAATSSNPPNQTLYVSNLSDKLPKADLRRNLYFLFTTYGPVLDIVALKTMKMRGQAFVVFRDTNAAGQAMRSLQGYDFFGREMKIAYAKDKSDTVAKLDGTFKIPITAEAAAAAAAASERTELQASIFAARPGAVATDEKEQAAESAKDAAGVKRPRDESDDDEAMDEDDDEGADMEMDESD